MKQGSGPGLRDSRHNPYVGPTSCAFEAAIVSSKAAVHSNPSKIPLEIVIHSAASISIVTTIAVLPSDV